MSKQHGFIKALGALLAAGLLACSMVATAEPLKVGFIYVSPIGDAGWTSQHDKGRLALEAALGDQVETKYVENVAEGADAERVIREFANTGYKVIFATSFGYMNYMEKVAKQYPNVVFLHATGYKSNGKNFGNYNARFYEGRYLSGIIAGAMSKSNILGYVAAFPIPEVMQGINAFTLGARSVNPKAEVRVIWTNSWYDPGKEREAAMTLISQGADVLTHHTDSTAIVQTAEEKGVYAIAYHSDMSNYGKDAQLTAVIHKWGDFYIQTAKDVMAGTWKPTNPWMGVKDGAIELAPLNPVIPADVVAKVTDVENSMKAGTFNPFTGPILDQQGKVVVPAGQSMSDAELSKMDFFVEGVASKLPNH